MDLGDDIMAKMTIKGTDELELQLSKLGTMSTKLQRCSYGRCTTVADEIRKGLQANLQGSKYSKATC